MSRLPLIDKLNNKLIVFENKLYQIKIELKPFYQMDKKEIMKLHDEYISNPKHEFGLASIGIPEFQRIQKYGKCCHALDISGVLKNEVNLDYKCQEKGECLAESFVCKG